MLEHFIMDKKMDTENYNGLIKWYIRELLEMELFKDKEHWRLNNIFIKEHLRRIKNMEKDKYFLITEIIIKAFLSMMR